MRGVGILNGQRTVFFLRRKRHGHLRFGFDIPVINLSNKSAIFQNVFGVSGKICSFFRHENRVFDLLSNNEVAMRRASEFCDKKCAEVTLGPQKSFLLNETAVSSQHIQKVELP